MAIGLLCCAGPNDFQVADFRAKLSDPTALKTHFSYHYSASLIKDGLANGTDPIYVYTMPRCKIQPMTNTLLSLCYMLIVAFKAHFPLPVNAQDDLFGLTQPIHILPAATLERVACVKSPSWLVVASRAFTSCRLC